jgi:hypothetical protein
MPILRQSVRWPSWSCGCQRGSDGANPAWTISGRMGVENNRAAKVRVPSSAHDRQNEIACDALQKFGGTVWVHSPTSRSNAEQTSRDAPEVLVCTSWQGNSLWPGRLLKHTRCHYDISNLGQTTPQSYRTLIFFAALLRSAKCVSIPGAAWAGAYTRARFSFPQTHGAADCLSASNAARPWMSPAPRPSSQSPAGSEAAQSRNFPAPSPTRLLRRNGLDRLAGRGDAGGTTAHFSCNPGRLDRLSLVHSPMIHRHALRADQPNTSSHRALAG